MKILLNRVSNLLYMIYVRYGVDIHILYFICYAQHTVVNFITEGINIELIASEDDSNKKNDDRNINNKTKILTRNMEKSERSKDF